MPLGVKKRTTVAFDEWQKKFIEVNYNGFTDALLASLAVRR
jgi:hypothetical protein